MFSPRSLWLCLGDILSYFNQFSRNFWPDEVHIVFNFLSFKKAVFLFFLDYFYFKDKVLVFFRRFISFFGYLLFVFLLCFYLKSFSVEINNTYLFVCYFFIALLASLKHRGWPAHLLSYLTFFFFLRLVYANLPISAVFLLWLAFFLFLRKAVLLLYLFILFGLMKWFVQKKKK